MIKEFSSKVKSENLHNSMLTLKSSDDNELIFIKNNIHIANLPKLNEAPIILTEEDIRFIEYNVYVKEIISKHYCKKLNEWNKNIKTSTIKRFQILDSNTAI